LNAPAATDQPAQHLSQALAVPLAQRRHLEPRTGPQGARVVIQGVELLNFCSNDYLGLANDARLLEAATLALRRYGVGAGAAGLLSGWTQAHEELSVTLAKFLGRDRALLFSSGYLANLGTVATFASRHSEVFHDRLNHASLIDGVSLSGAHSRRYRHADMADLERQLRASTASTRLILTDTVFSMDGDIAPVAALARLAHDHAALLICDDAHGFGVLGRGRGLLVQEGVSQAAAPLLVVTFGKALGSVGAAVVGRGDLIETLLQRARPFIYDTAMPPALAAASTAALHILSESSALVDQLAANTRYFKQALAAAGIVGSLSTTPIQPIILGAEETALRAAASLREQGFYVRAVRPPTVPKGTSRLRICLSAAHTQADIAALVAALPRALAA
jgi:8-amino-7-oxononanoate synthase